MAELQELVRRERGLGEWCILHAYRGSIAHGLFIPPDDPMSTDDVDTMAVCVPDREHYLGLRQYGSRGTKEVKRGSLDVVVYEARKAISLLAKGNPNVLSLLYVEPEHVIKMTLAGRLLVENRAHFVGRHVHRSFCGYASAQLKKMERSACQGYMGEKRREIVRRFGYDVKNAAHLVRLLRMGTEYLRTGRLQVCRRDDADDLMAIKRGEWSLEAVKAEADRLFGEARQAYEQSHLPDRPDMEAINALCVRVVEEAWREQRLRKEGRNG